MNITLKGIADVFINCNGNQVQLAQGLCQSRARRLDVFIAEEERRESQKAFDECFISIIFKFILLIKK